MRELLPVQSVSSNKSSKIETMRVKSDNKVKTLKIFKRRIKPSCRDETGTWSNDTNNIMNVVGKVTCETGCMVPNPQKPYSRIITVVVLALLALVLWVGYKKSTAKMAGREPGIMSTIPTKSTPDTSLPTPRTLFVGDVPEEEPYDTESD